MFTTRKGTENGLLDIYINKKELNLWRTSVVNLKKKDEKSELN